MPPILTSHNPHSYSKEQIVEMCWVHDQMGMDMLMVFEEPAHDCMVMVGPHGCERCEWEAEKE